MATLFERLIGLNLPGQPQLDEEKIAIHAFDSSMNYIGFNMPGYGDITGAMVAGWFDLNADQQQQMIYLYNLIQDAADVGARTSFQRANKDYLYLGESSIDVMWQDEDAYWATLQKVITGAGGTPTPKPF